MNHLQNEMLIYDQVAAFSNLKFSLYITRFKFKVWHYEHFIMARFLFLSSQIIVRIIISVILV